VKLVDVMIVVLGAGIGGGARYAIGGFIANNLSTSFPWHTFVINISGAFLLGLLMALSIDRGLISGGWRLFLGTGLLGGFTTFSAFSLDFALLVERKAYVAAAGYGVASVVLSLGAVFVGLALGRSVLT